MTLVGGTVEAGFAGRVRRDMRTGCARMGLCWMRPGRSNEVMKGGSVN